MDISETADILGIFSFGLTFFTLLAALNVRSQIIHSHEKQMFKADCKQINGKIDGYIRSLLTDKLTSPNFYQQIDVYMSDLLSKYSFLSIQIKIKCKAISKKIHRHSNEQDFRTTLAKLLTELKNLLSKETNL